MSPSTLTRTPGLGASRPPRRGPACASAPEVFQDVLVEDPPRGALSREDRDRQTRLLGQARATVARATRLSIEAPPELPSWVLLHELAHAMTGTVEGENDGHGPRFVGLYLRLLVRHARMPEEELARSLREAGIAFDPDARPVFLDG